MIRGRYPCLFLKWKSLVLVLAPGPTTINDNLINDGNMRLLLTLLESCNKQTSVGYVCHFHLFSLPRYLALNKTEDCVGSEKVPKSLSHFKSNSTETRVKEKWNFFFPRIEYILICLCATNFSFFTKSIYLHKCIFGRYLRGSRISSRFKRPSKF